MIAGQIGVDPGAAAKGVEMLSGAIVLIALSLAILLLVFIFVGISVGSRYRQKKTFWIVAGAVLLVFVAGGLTLWLPLEKTLEWDVSKSHGSADIGWPTDNKSDWLHRSNVSVLIHTPHGLGYQASAAHVWVDREGDVLRRIKVAERPMTLDDVLARMRSFDQGWKVNPDALSRWEKAAIGGKADAFLSCARNDAASFETCFEIRSSANSDRPFTIQFTMFWLPEALKRDAEVK